MTRAAVRQLQAKYGQSDTGLVDDDLCKAIDADLAAMRPTT